MPPNEEVAIPSVENPEKRARARDEPSPDDHASGSIVTRRRALQILGALPAAAALGAQQPAAQQPQKPLQPGVTSQVPSTATPGAPKGPRFFTKHEWATVAM